MFAPGPKWIRAYVPHDTLFCVYRAEKEAIREHGRCGGFPVDSIRRIHTFIYPTTPAAANIGEAIAAQGP